MVRTEIWLSPNLEVVLVTPHYSQWKYPRKGSFTYDIYYHDSYRKWLRKMNYKKIGEFNEHATLPPVR